MNSKRNVKGKGGKKAIKVVYISSPMKVKASASEFRDLVQQVKRKEFDATRFMDANELLLSEGIVGDCQEAVFPFMSSYQEPSTSSDSVFEPFDKLLPTFEVGFMDMSKSSFFYETSQLPVA